MPKRNAPQKRTPTVVIISSILLLLSIPLVVWGTLQSNFDIRNQAYEELYVSSENPCVISFPNVNPYTLEVGKTFTISVDAELENAGIASLNISDSSGSNIYTESFENNPTNIATSFNYTPEKSGEIDITGFLTKTGGGSVACKISSPYDILGVNAISSNSAPIITSTLQDANPSQAIETSDDFEYVFTAKDDDGDKINYSISFTPKADWLKTTVIEDGSDGNLTIKFKGSTTDAASYLANVFIHDGYTNHLSAQSWVISVSPEENDNPTISIVSPTTSLRLDQGEKFTAKWDANDLNQIIKYQLYITKNVTNEDSWVTISNNISYKTTSYTVDTKSLEAGTYKLIARAVDNQTPAGIGTDISNEIVISATSQTDTQTDDTVTIPEPQVTNMSPTSTEEVTNTMVTVKATVIAGEDAVLEDGNIIFTLDDRNVTEEIKINKISESTYTLIFQTEEALDGGLHKAEIYVQDSNGGETTKSWTFTIQTEEEIDTSVVDIFGMEVARRTVYIIGGGILLVILAIVAPIIIFSVWKEDKGENIDAKNSKVPPTPPTDTSPYQQQMETKSEVKEMVDTKPVVEEAQEEQDPWDKFSAVQPDEKDTQEQSQKVEIKEPAKPRDLPTENTQNDDLALLKGEEPKPEIPAQPQQKPQETVGEKPVQEQPTNIPEPDIPTFTESNIPEPEIPTPPKEEVKVEVQNTQPTPPEPEIKLDENNQVPPSNEEDIQKLYQQIQDVQNDNKQKDSSEQPTSQS